MAGIGFRLKKFLSDDTYTGLIKGYFFGSVLSSGPWIFTIFSLAVIQLFAARYLTIQEADTFTTSITYTFAFSLITFGLMEMVITRYLADKLFLREGRILFASFISILSPVLLFQVILASLLYVFTDFSLSYKFAGIALHVLISSLWVVMIFLSATKNYIAIAISFLAGAIVSALASVEFSRNFGVTGALVGVALGQAVTLSGLVWRLYREFHFYPFFSNEIFHYYRKHSSLIWVGFLYNAGLWVDKILFWYLGPSTRISGPFYNDELYGSALYLAYITMIPALTIFLVKIETSFYIAFRAFYQAIEAKKGLKDLLKIKEQLILSLRTSARPLVTFQTGLCICCVVFAPTILNFFRLRQELVAIFQIGTIGVFFQVLMVIMGIIILYFNGIQKVIFLYATFFVTNLIFSLLTLKWGFPTYGYGFTAACFIGFMMAYRLHEQQIQNFDYETFFYQPIVSPNIYKIQETEPLERAELSQIKMETKSG
ncbi:MAG: exopolysaccharide Pel transporter PelG [Deltaproteobacteria bacterium]|nr:exopolysaccharide Pel transporter PelG [Deltaproteobacteria bacterium]